MKKVVSVLLMAVMVICLCSCGNSVPKIPSLNFTTDAEISYKQYDVISCKMENQKDGPLTVSISKPAFLSNLSLVCEKDKCTVKLGSLSYDADINKFPQLGFGDILKQALIAAMETATPEKNDDGTWSVKAQTDAGNIELKLDGKTGYPISLSVPDKQVNITFSNFTETDNAENTTK